MDIESTAVYQVNPDATIVTWAFKFGDPISGQVTINRSYSPETTSFSAVGSAAASVGYFKDVEANTCNRWRKPYYFLTLPDSKKSDIFSLESDLDAVGRAIITYEHNLLRFAGFPILIYLRRYGARCPECWDAREKVKTKSTCLRCYNTGYDGGYYSPFLTLANLQTPKQPVDQTSQYLEQPSRIRVMMSNFPEVQPGSIVLEVNKGRRWMVSPGIETTQRKRIVVHQVLSLEELNPHDIEHQLPIPDKLEYIIKPFKPLGYAGNKFDDVVRYDDDSNPDFAEVTLK